MTGIGLISALGGNLEDSWQNLLAGKSGIRLHQPFPKITPLPLGLIGQKPSELTMLTQMVVSSALQDSGLVSHAADCAVVLGSSRSYQASWEILARQIYEDAANLPVSSFGNWLDTLPHMNAIAAARQIGASGIVLAPMAACATGIWSNGHIWAGEAGSSGSSDFEIIKFSPNHGIFTNRISFCN